MIHVRTKVYWFPLLWGVTQAENVNPWAKEIEMQDSAPRGKGRKRAQAFSYPEVI